jgi:predicted nucleic acid-binding Zn ribbon protein
MISPEQYIVIGHIQNSRFYLCFFFDAGFLAPDKKTGQLIVGRPVADFNEMRIARGCQVLCNVTGIAGLAVVDDANLYCDSVGGSRKKIAGKNFLQWKNAGFYRDTEKNPRKRSQRNLDLKTFKGIIFKMMNEYPRFFKRKNNLK